MDHLPVEQAGAAGDRGQKPEQQHSLRLVVKREPEAEQQIRHLLRDGEHGERDPVGHPACNHCNLSLSLHCKLDQPMAYQLTYSFTFLVLTALKDLKAG